MTDRRLVRRFLRGEEAAFRLLYARHTPALLQLSLRLVGGRASEAEDVVQEAWIRAAESIARFEWRSELRTWLKGITINCAREALRRKRIRRTEALEEVPEVAGGAAPPGPVTVLDLERAIAALPDELRVAFVLFASDGPSAGRLEVGDTIVRVDDLLVTTRDGSRRFFFPGEDGASLAVRRRGSVLEVRVVPGTECAEPGPAPP